MPLLANEDSRRRQPLPIRLLQLLTEARVLRLTAQAPLQLRNGFVVLMVVQEGCSQTLVQAEINEYAPPIAGKPARLAWHGWVENAGQKIQAEVGIAQRDLANQVDILREQVGQMRRAFAAQGE